MNIRKYRFIILIFVLFSLVGFKCGIDVLQPTTEELLEQEVLVQAGMPSPIEEYFRQKKPWLLDVCLAYYTKYIDAGGLWIIGGDYVRDEHFYAARQCVLLMTAKHPEIRVHLSQRFGFRLILLSSEQPPSSEKGIELNYAELPDFPGWWGLGWYTGLECVSYVGWQLQRQREGPDKRTMSFMRVFIHEFAHAMHSAFGELYPTFNDRLSIAYRDALIPTHSYYNENSYALEYAAEYWAEFVSQYWFFKSPMFMNNAFKSGTSWDATNKDTLMVELCEEWLPQIYLRPLDYMEEPVEWEWEWEADESE